MQIRRGERSVKDLLLLWREQTGGYLYTWFMNGVTQVGGTFLSPNVVSMDWKLASEVRRASDSPERVAGDFHGAHVEFLRTARRASEVLVKVVGEE